MKNSEKWFYVTLVLLTVSKLVYGKMEGFIVNGKETTTTKFPHVVHLTVSCHSQWNCGGTILTQDIIITAAHCFDGCPIGPKTKTNILAGEELLNASNTNIASEIRIHEYYDAEAILNDIALVRSIEPFKFSSKIKRAAILKSQYGPLAGDIAGWGYKDEKEETPSNILLTASQRVWSREECVKFLEAVPLKAFCAGDKNKNRGYTSSGDSGSGLVVKKYILIGILSYKDPEVSSSVAIYTNVTSYYSWIVSNSVRLFCNKSKHQ